MEQVLQALRLDVIASTTNTQHRKYLPILVNLHGDPLVVLEKCNIVKLAEQYNCQYSNIKSCE